MVLVVLHEVLGFPPLLRHPPPPSPPNFYNAPPPLVDFHFHLHYRARWARGGGDGNKVHGGLPCREVGVSLVRNRDESGMRNSRTDGHHFLFYDIFLL